MTPNAQRGTRRSKTAARRTGKRPTFVAPPPAPVAAADERTGGKWSAYLDQAEKDGLPVSFIVDVPEAPATSTTIRVSGQRLDHEGRLTAGDRFTTDEVIQGMVPGSGPASVTVRVLNINSGDWEVRAELLQPDTTDQRRFPQRAARRRPVPVTRAAWSWFRWTLVPGAPTPVHTCMAPLANLIRTPAVIPFIWGPMAAAGIVLALILEGMLSSRDGVAVRAVITVLIVAVTVGIVGAKVWYVVLHRKDGSRNGWCIQGLLVGVTAVVIAGVALARLPLGVVLDALAPGLLFGMAIGRIGCFFAGCCAGRPTASRWGIRSSDRRICARRIPTQLIEAALCIMVATGALAVTLGRDPGGNGALFVASLAAYTLVRQAILRLRSEKRRSVIGGPLTAAIAAAALGVSVVTLAVTR